MGWGIVSRRKRLALAGLGAAIPFLGIVAVRLIWRQFQ
jgi:hypothetical protein